MERALFSGNTEGLITHLLVIVGYTVAITILAIVLFLRQMRNK